MDILQVHKTSTHAILPSSATDGAAGYDLYSFETTTIIPYSRSVIDTGIVIKLPPGTYGRIADKSGLAARSGLVVGGGVIDCDYTGSIKIILFNHSNDNITIPPGLAIAQLICEVYKKPIIVEKVCTPTGSARGEQGLGSGISKPSAFVSTSSQICSCEVCNKQRLETNKAKTFKINF